ncbi:MAG: hypothetical protein ABUL41_00255 [Chitinophagaceae bacterium]
MKIYLIITTIAISLSSCLKQSISDAMLGTSKKTSITATLSYEINGNLVSITVNDVDNQPPGFRTLYCEKSNGYLLSAVSNSGELVFTFLTDSLKVGSYNYPGNWGPTYVTDFQGRPQYVYSSTDNMSFNVTTYKDGHISGNFSGRLTPLISAGNPNNIYGTPGSVLIKNGSFNNVPIVY